MIHCTDIEFTYDGERLALAGIDLHVAPGEFVCILGGNGSGKSTLAKHLNALLLPDRGTVTVDGYDTAEPRDVYRIRSTAGMVFQNPDDQLVASLVENDVAFGPENLGVPTSQLATLVKRSLAEVGLQGYDARETNALSGGQKQRVAIAGVLAMEPQVLVLDEPCAGLDPRGREEILGLIRALHRESGATIVMVSHPMDDVASLAGRVIVMNHGCVAMDGTPREVFARGEELRAIGLDVPQAVELAERLRERGLDIPQGVYQMEELRAAIAAAVGKGKRHA